MYETRIENEKWIFEISDVFHLTEQEYRANEAYNDKLGDYEPENERPVNSVATILATGASGELVTLKWSAGKKGVYPHISRKGWSKGLFVKLNQILSQWTFESN